jgi:hypothetical protein
MRHPVFQTQMRRERWNVPNIMHAGVRAAALLALSLAPLAPAFAGHGRLHRTHEYRATYETYSGARSYAKARARKVCRQEREYRTEEDRRLARHGIARRDRPLPPSYASPWSRCTTAWAY